MNAKEYDLTREGDKYQYLQNIIPFVLSKVQWARIDMSDCKACPLYTLSLYQAPLVNHLTAIPYIFIC